MKYFFHDTEVVTSEDHFYEIGVISSASVPSRKPTTIRVNRP